MAKTRKALNKQRDLVEMIRAELQSYGARFDRIGLLKRMEQLHAPFDEARAFLNDTRGCVMVGGEFIEEVLGGAGLGRAAAHTSKEASAEESGGETRKRGRRRTENEVPTSEQAAATAAGADGETSTLFKRSSAAESIATD